jgi:hypothetical protein
MTNKKQDWTLNEDQLRTLQEQAYQLGLRAAITAVTTAGYSDHKRNRVKDHVEIDLAPLNDHLHKVLSQTPEARHFFPQPH